MKFTYEYRTSDNVRHEGVVEASDREAAFQRLKAQGIKPGRLAEAPGFFNKLFGKGKRWLVIGVLAVLCLVLGGVALHQSRAVEAEKLEARYYEPRSQIYGDPYVLENAYQNLWRNYLPNWGDAFLALYAVPGHQMVGVPKEEYDAVMLELERGRDALLEVSPDDLEEVAQMKRMVNGMKREFRQYVGDGGSAREYAKDLVIRAKAELAICAEAHRVLEKGEADQVNATNHKLRAMGLPLLTPKHGE